MSPIETAIVLKDRATGQLVDGVLVDAILQSHLEDWEARWKPALTTAIAKRKAAFGPGAPRPESAHWDWAQKASYIDGLLGARGFCVVANGVVQGLMTLDLTKLARHRSQAKKPLVYVDFLETAPWNRTEFNPEGGLSGVGTALLTAASVVSLEEGFRGRIGLHSLPSAELFYRDVIQMDDFGPDAAYQNLRYFEMTAERARDFLGYEEDR